MKLRLLSIAFLFGVLGTGLTWLTLQPVVYGLVKALGHGAPARETAAHLRTLLPLVLCADALVLVGVTYFMLYLTIERPLAVAQRSVEQLERLDLDSPFVSSGGPVLARFQGSLRRATEGLREQQALTRARLLELQRSNDRLSAAQTELVASERLATVGKLAAGVAHEVGNPLSGILGYVSLVRGRMKDQPDLDEYLSLVENEVSRIDRIVRQLLELGRPSQPRMQPVLLLGLAQTCVQLVRGGPDFEHVEASVDLESQLLVRADPGPLSQVFLNLLLNAAQAMGGRGSLRVHARVEGERVRVLVDDTGPGIAASALPQLFEPFFTTRSAGKGTGLGLSVSDHLVRSMGGELHAENREQGGARFVVSLQRG